MRNCRMGKRILSVFLMLTLAFMLPAGPLCPTKEVQAATVKSDATYISETKLFIKKDGNVEDAKNWCKNKGDGWQVLEGDLNAGASGAMTKEVGVFLCYKTTTDPDDAITDLAVMNEKGNYSEGEYKNLLKKQKESYIEMVKNMNGMLEEYRTNFEKKVPVAVKAHDFLNAYVDDDSKQLLGDLLLTVDDDKLSEILLQANGIVILTIQQQLASACDTAKTTWLDRMAKLGGYDTLKAAASKNIKSGNVAKTMDAKYKDIATSILDNWDDIQKKIADFGGFIEEYGMENATEAQYDEWIKNVSVEDKEFASFQEFLTLMALVGYDYGDQTLFDFFSKSKAQIEKEGLEVLYPMAASLTKGQICALEESVGIFTLVQDALSANIYNDYDAGMAGTVKKSLPADVKSDVKSTIDGMKESVASLKDGEKISIYEGVDRDMFAGGVAVTSEAQNNSKGSENSWTNAFNRDGAPTILSYGLGIGAAGTAILAGVFAYCQAIEPQISVVKRVTNLLRGNPTPGTKAVIKKISTETQAYIGGNIYIDYYSDLKELVEFKEPQAIKAYDEFVKASNEVKSRNFYVYRGLKWGFTVFTILMSVADVVINSYALYKYYNVEHLEIPHHMVDVSYSEKKEESYVVYKSVRDQDEKCGDLNGNNSKQWLALYYTKDGRAGDPILAPTKDGNEMVVKTGTTDSPGDGYSPMHMFGTVNVAQNLTFADGDKGFSYNDKSNGTYMYFTHAKGVITYEGKENKDSDQTATVMGAGVVGLVGAAGIVLGGIIGFVLGMRRRRKMV